MVLCKYLYRKAVSLSWIEDIFGKDKQAVRCTVPLQFQKHPEQIVQSSSQMQVGGKKKKQHSECNYANVLDNVIEKKGCRQGERWQAINPRAAENGDSCHLCNRKDLAQVWGWEKLSAVSENDSHCLGKLWILVPSLACWSCSAGLLESSLRSQRQRDSGLICEKIIS